MIVENKIDHMLNQKNVSDEARANLLVAKALTTLTTRNLHLDGLTPLITELKILNRNIGELTQQMMYIRGRM